MKDETAQPEETQDEERVEEPAEELPPGSITEPAKLLRIVSMVRELLEETRQTTVDERGRAQLRQISINTSCTASSASLVLRR